MSCCLIGQNALGSQDLVSGHKVKKFVLTHTTTLGQDEGYCLKIVMLNFTKLSIKFQ